MLILNPINNGGFPVGNSFERMTVNPRPDRPGGLSICKAGWAHVAVNRLPVDWDWPHPHCELIDRIIRQRFLKVNLQQHPWRNEASKCFCRTVKPSHFSNRSVHNKAVFECTHVDFLILLLSVYGLAFEVKSAAHNRAACSDYCSEMR